MNEKLLWPWTREEIQSCFSLVYDQERQKGWFDPNFKHSFWDSLGYYIFDYLIDGPPHLYSEAHKAIGLSLYDQEEAEIMERYLNFYQDTFEGEMPDDYYINHPQWPKLIEGARYIVALMEANNEKYDFGKDLKDCCEEMEQELMEERRAKESGT